MGEKVIFFGFYPNLILIPDLKATLRVLLKSALESVCMQGEGCCMQKGTQNPDFSDIPRASCI